MAYYIGGYHKLTSSGPGGSRKGRKRSRKRAAAPRRGKKKRGKLKFGSPAWRRKYAAKALRNRRRAARG
jgi:hypothetical protein